MNDHRGGRIDRRSRPQRAAWPTFVRALGLLKPHGFLLLAFLTIIALTSMAGLAPPLLIRSLIDHAIPEEDNRQINAIVLVMLLIIVLTALAGVLQSYLSN